MSISTEASSLVNQIISQATDLLRGKVKVHDFHTISYLLLLQKEGIIQNTTRLLPESLHKDILRKVADCKHEQKTVIIKLLYVYQHTLSEIDSRTLYKLLKLIEAIDKDFLDRHIDKLVESVIYFVANAEGRSGGEYVQPLELTKFICSLAELSEGATVYNPFAGIASFGVYLNEGVKYHGQEINNETWAIGTLRLLANKKVYSDYVVGDSINNWNPHAEQYDLIVANPPFGLKTIGEGINKNSSTGIDEFVVEQSFESLKYNGTAILVLSTSFLYSNKKSAKLLRRFYLERGFIKSVISFPGGLLTNTNIPFTVLVLNKNHRRREVLFVDAAGSIKEASRREKRIDFEHLISVVSTPELPHSKVVSIDEVIHEDYNLNVPRYLTEDKFLPNSEPLDKLIKRAPKGKVFTGIPGRNRTGLEDDGFGRFVRVRDLKDDKQDFILNADAIEYEELPKAAIKLDRSALLLATRWKSLKPTYFRYDEEPVFLSPDVVAFEVNERMVDVAYLVNELHADYVTDQLNRYRVGSLVPVIPVSDLLKVKVELPPVAEQIAKVKGAKELLKQLQVLKAERNALAHGVIKKQFEDFASLKHTLGAPRQNILSYSEALISFFKDRQSNAFKEVNSELIQLLGQDLLTIFRNIKSDINFISELLEKGEQGLILEEHELQDVTIGELQKLANDFKGAFFKFNLEVRGVELNEEQKLGITANKALFKALLFNILSNADKHGFDQKGKDNEVVIDLSVIDNMFVVDIKNNGKPFPRNFDKDKFIARYSTADVNNGSGIGGYDINRIVTYFNGTWELFLNEDLIYPVRFNFQFPVTLMK